MKPLGSFKLFRQDTKYKHKNKQFSFLQQLFKQFCYNDATRFEIQNNNNDGRSLERSTLQLGIGIHGWLHNIFKNHRRTC